MECMGVASGCGELEVGVASGSGWNLWVWLLGVVVRRYSKTSLIRAAWVTGVPVTKNCPYVRIVIFNSILYCYYICLLGSYREVNI